MEIGFMNRKPESLKPEFQNMMAHLLTAWKDWHVMAPKTLNDTL